uniref:Chromosome 14 open reading frame 93 n=1 Tax=Laticauda laticaudata TaxID=8630 RepID=A0A8C5RQT0_LATLA
MYDRNFYYSARQLLSELCPILQPSLFTVVAEECTAGDAPMPLVYVPPSPAPQMAHQPPFQPLEEPLSCPEGSPSSTTHEEPTNVEPHFCVGFAGLPCRSRNLGQKNARRKRDLVLSKLVHNVHNHITNEKRFDGAESIKSSWNISVVKFLLEKLKHELVSNHHNYTDKELKGACVAYFLTKRREYRNSLNPFKGLKEKEEKKLRSRRYRLFANRSGVARLLGSDEQRLWQGVTEELMSDEEDSTREAGVWVARSPRFRAMSLSQLCYRLDANSKHGTKANRVYGPPSERLPSAEVQLLPPQLYNSHFQEEDPKMGTPCHKAFASELNSFVEIKVEKDQ